VDTRFFNTSKEEYELISIPKDIGSKTNVFCNTDDLLVYFAGFE